MRFLQNILANWKTTITGIGTAAGGVATVAGALSDGFQAGDGGLISTGVTAFLGGLGLIFARDGDKSSEASGAK